VISLEVFIDMASQKTNKTPEKIDIKELFNIFDRDKNGQIWADEIQYVLHNLGKILEKEDIDEIVN
jgi:Ca2+-binding EF-hand superfamily protein